MLHLTLSILFAAIFAIHSSDAISCHHCKGNTTDCEKLRAIVNCGELPFCFIKIDQDADTVIQTCASAVDCRYQPNEMTTAAPSLDETETETPSKHGETETTSAGPTAMETTTHKVTIECCEQDHCNCAGVQCFPDLGSAAGKIVRPSLVAFFAAVLLFAF